MSYGRQSGKERLIVKSATKTLFCEAVDSDSVELKAIELCLSRDWGGSQDMTFFLGDRLVLVLIPNWTDENLMVLLDPSSRHIHSTFRIDKSRLHFASLKVEEKL